MKTSTQWFFCCFHNNRPSFQEMNKQTTNNNFQLFPGGFDEVNVQGATCGCGQHTCLTAWGSPVWSLGQCVGDVPESLSFLQIKGQEIGYFGYSKCGARGTWIWWILMENKITWYLYKKIIPHLHQVPNKVSTMHCFDYGNILVLRCICSFCFSILLWCIILLIHFFLELLQEESHPTVFRQK